LSRDEQARTKHGVSGTCREREIRKVKFVALWQGRKIPGEKYK